MTFWDDWAATARDRDRSTRPSGRPIELADVQRLSILHVRAYAPVGGQGRPIRRHAPERWVLAWQPPWLRGQPRLLKYRQVSYTTVN